MENHQINQFDPDTDISSVGPRWQLWIIRLENFFKTFTNEPDSQKKLAFLLHCAGPRVLELFQTVQSIEVQATDPYEAAKKRLGTLFDPKRNKTVERFEFRRLRQQETESIEQFVTRLRIAAQYCEFGNVTDDEIAGQVVQACSSDKLRRQLLQIDLLCLKDVLEKGRIHDSVESQARTLETKPLVNSVKPPSQHFLQPTNNQQRTLNSVDQGKGRPSKTDPNRCANCGHPYPHNTRCPAFTKTCSACNKQNHFAAVCLSTSSHRSRKDKQHLRHNKTHDANKKDHSVNAISTEPVADWSGPERYPVFNIGVAANLPHTIVQIDGFPVEVLIDTGCSINVLDEPTYSRLDPRPSLSPSSKLLFSYQASSNLQTVGEFSSTVKWRDSSLVTRFVVAKGNNGCLLGHQAAVQLGIVNLACSVTQSRDPYLTSLKSRFPTVFSGKIGKLKNFKLSLHIDKNVKPVAQKHRLIPFYQRNALETELNRRVEQDIIEPVLGQPTEWISQLVIFFKPNSNELRICSDNRDVNRAIKRERHLMPTLEELVQQVQGAKLFTKLDLNSAFEQIELDEESRRITTFSTHIGLFRYKRLNLGICSAPEIFHNLIRKSLLGLQGVLNAHDDILCYGANIKELESIVNAVLTRLASLGLTLNIDKCEFNKEKVDFFGLNFSSNGVNLKEVKAQALKNAKKPTNASELHSFLGLAVWCSKFIENFSSISAPLWDLIKKGKRWQWEAEHETAFVMLKQAPLNAIGFFNSNWESLLTVDASPVGLGAVLRQFNASNPSERQVVSFASRSLSETEKRYSQLEKEALAIVWACERLYLYLVGRKFTLETDNRALQLILSNPSSNPPARLRRYALRIQPFQFTVIHRPGLGNVADYLSRHPAQVVHRKNEDDYVNAIVTNVIPRAISRETLVKTSSEDETIQLLVKSINSGKIDHDNRLKPFKPIFNELCVSLDGIVLRGDRIVLPTSLRSTCVDLAHEGHLGIVKTKRLLRSRVWFPGLDDLVETKIRSCLACQANGPEEAKPTVIPSDLPPSPWHTVGIDFFGPFQNVYLLVVYDLFSKFPVVNEVSSTKCNIVKDKLTKIFSTFGIPHTVISDNGPPFNSSEFKDFASSLGFHHRKITPYWPQANGAAESFMKNIGKVIRCASVTGLPWRNELTKFLANFRATPHLSTGSSPSELIFNNSNTSKLPSIQQNSIKVNKPFFYNNQTNPSLLVTSQPKFKPNDQVLLKWQRDNKSKPRFDPDPYFITSTKGTMVTACRRNRFVTRNESFFKLWSPTILRDDTVIQKTPTVELELIDPSPSNFTIQQGEEIVRNPIISTPEDRQIDHQASNTPTTTIPVQNNFTPNTENTQPLQATSMSENEAQVPSDIENPIHQTDNNENTRRRSNRNRRPVDRFVAGPASGKRRASLPPCQINQDTN